MKLNTEIVRHLRSEELKTKMAADGAEVIASFPEDLAKWLRDDLALRETREGFGRARIDCSSDKWIME